MIRPFRKPRRRRRAQPSSINIDVAVLDDRILYSANPLAMTIDSAEDTPNFEVDLHDLFTIDDGGGETQFSLLSDAESEHFDSLEIADGLLHVDLRGNANGLAEISLQAENGGESQLLDLTLDIESVNDSPVFLGFNNVVTSNGVTTVNLHDAFDDVEDADADLGFEFLSNNPDAFDQFDYDPTTGLLTIHHRAGAAGLADLTVVATDSGGLSTGKGTDSDFHVYNYLQLRPKADETYAVVGDTMQFWTSWYFFEKVNGQYDYSELDVDGFVSKVESYASSESRLMFDVENSYYTNSPEGRDRFAEIAYLARQASPDLDIGFYRMMPERNWYTAIHWARAQRDAEMGLTTAFSVQYDHYQQRHDEWLANNELYRTVPVSDEFGGVPLADLVDTIYPSLYTFFYDNVQAVSHFYHVDLDANDDTLTVTGIDFTNVNDHVRLRIGDGGTLQNGLVPLRDYYVVNRVGDSFQISETPDGTPIDFSDNFTGEVFVQGFDFTDRDHLDRNVLDWFAYAEDNLVEARKYAGKDVVPWLSPSLAGIGRQYISGDFFRLQLETVRELGDSVALFDLANGQVPKHINSGWFTALNDFVNTLDDAPATLTIDLDVPADPPPPTDPTPVDPPPVDPPAPDPPPTPLPDPVAHDDSVQTVEDQPVGINIADLLSNDQDIGNGDFDVIASPSHGDVTVSDGMVHYQPDRDFYGLDSFQYEIDNGQGALSTATVFVQVNEQNDAPIAANDFFATPNNQLLLIQASDLLQNDIDADADELSLEITGLPQHGVLSFTGDGGMVYEANAGFNGADTIEYRVFDGTTQSEAATIHINIFSTRGMARPDEIVTTQNTPTKITTDMLLANDDLLPSGNGGTIQIVDKPSHGVIDWSNDGRSFRYMPDSGFHGIDQITYRLVNDESASNTTTLRLRVDPTTEVSDDNPSLFGVTQGRELSVSAIDLVHTGRITAAEMTTIELARAPQFGTAAIDSFGMLTYQPNQGFLGRDDLAVRISNGHDWSDVALIEIMVYPDVAQVSPGESPLAVRKEALLKADR